MKQLFQLYICFVLGIAILMGIIVFTGIKNEFKWWFLALFIGGVLRKLNRSK